MPDILDDEILENAQGPESVTGDGVTVKQFSLSEQIAAAKYLKGAAASADPAACLRRVILVLPGTV